MRTNIKSEYLRLVVKFNRQKYGWVVVGAPGRQIVFATKMDAENYCVYQLHQCPISTASKNEYQDLPHRSVWTGAPWDHTFAHLRPS
jgi:hypothetical protein